MSKFFIERPIFAWVIAILIMISGIICVLILPIAQYPQIAPPIVTINATYPGASAKSVEDSVTQVIEQHMKGLDNLIYMASTSDSAGSSTVSLTFDNGTNPDIAQVQVQNKLQLATPLLPESVQRQGISVSKAGHNFLLVVGFISTDGSMSAEDISDYVASNLQDPLSRVQGVGDLQIFGAQYAMRIWCNPSLLEKYSLTPADIVSAIQAQNTEISAGQIGGSPSAPGQTINMTVTSQSRLENAEQFENILLKSMPDGSSVYLKDVARCGLGAETYGFSSRYNGQPASGMGIKLASGGNAIATVANVQAALDELSPFFPPGLKAVFSYDTTPFVKISIREVVKTLVEAVILVFLLMFLFLQSFRATLIPTIAVPVVLLGTFAAMAVAGFSINTLTMFGMVLAIGLLVDDAIIVVENVERIMKEEKLPPKEATKKSMEQITGALVGVAMVLSAVFIPMAFFGGATGVIYRQFSITIVSAMCLSVLVALILTPALCATMLKDYSKDPHHKEGRFFTWFNKTFENATHKYQRGVASVIKHKAIFMLFYLLIVGAMALMFLRMPTGFLPEEDQGILLMQVLLPSGATLDRTERALALVENYFDKNEADTVESVMAVAGFSFSGTGQNSGMGFIRLKDWDLRTKPEMRAQPIAMRAMGAISKIDGLQDAQVFVFAPPAVMELGAASGFDFQLKDMAGRGHDFLTQERNKLFGMIADPSSGASAVIRNVRPNGLEDTDQYNLNIDMAKAASSGINLGEITATITALWGSAYVNDFMDRGRIKKVFIQAEAPYRMQPEDFERIRLRNNQGQMVPFSTVVTGGWGKGSPRLERYNGVSSMEILGEPLPGISSGDAMAKMVELTSKLDTGVGYEWTGLSLEEALSAGQAPLLYAISLLVVFLCLAALYESWSIPFSVLLVVPVGVLGSLAACSARGFANDIYFKVGMLTIIGLSAKNAILIVEFAKELIEGGRDIIDATLEAVRLRLRPIIMTSMAFILGVTPLAISRGAGSGSQNDIGTGVIGGMLSSTFLGIFFIPLFFVLITQLFSRGRIAKDLAMHHATGESVQDGGENPSGDSKPGDNLAKE